MKKTAKQMYTSPCIKVFTLHAEQLLQTVSVTPNAQETTTTPWDSEQEHQGGLEIIGDGSDIAPAKRSNGLWDAE